MGEIFNITHDANDLDEYTSIVTDGGDLSTGTPGLASTAARMEALINDTTVIYGQKDFTQITATAYRFRFYIDPNTLTMGAGEDFRVCRLQAGNSVRSWVSLQYDGGYEIRAGIINDDVEGKMTDWYDVTDAEHYIEVLVEYGSGADENDGELTLWIDGVQRENRGGLDIYNISKPDGARLGAVKDLDVGTSGTLFLDEFVFRDDDIEIGPAPAGVAMPIFAIDGIHSAVFGGQVVR